MQAPIRVGSWHPKLRNRPPPSPHPKPTPTPNLPLTISLKFPNFFIEIPYSWDISYHNLIKEMKKMLAPGKLPHGDQVSQDQGQAQGLDQGLKTRLGTKDKLLEIRTKLFQAEHFRLKSCLVSKTDKKHLILKNCQIGNSI